MKYSEDKHNLNKHNFVLYKLIKLQILNICIKIHIHIRNLFNNFLLDHLFLF